MQGAAGTLLAVGDLTTDIVVRHPSVIAAGTDNPSDVAVRRGGSAANVCAVSARLGRRSRLLTVRGVDRPATERVAELEALGVEVVGPTTDRGPAIVVLVDPAGERTFLTDRGAPPDVGAWSTVEFDRLLTGVDRVHLCGYWLFDGATRAVSRSVADAARVRGVPISFDPSSVSLFGSVDAVAETLSIHPQFVLPNADEDLAVDSRWPGTVVVTDGPRAVLVRHEGVERMVPLVDASDSTAQPARERRSGEMVVDNRIDQPVVDTTGAGDAFAAGFLARFDAGGAPSSENGPRIDAAVRAGHRAALAVIGGYGADAWQPAVPTDDPE